MPKISPLNSKKLTKILQKTGFKTIPQKGSHLIMMDDRQTRIVVPVHPGKDIKPQLIRAIIKEAGLSRTDFFKLLNDS